MTNVTTSTRRFAERTLGVCAILALASCFGEKVTGPEMRRGYFAFAPIFQNRRALSAVTVDSVHIVVLLPGTSTVVLDTTVFFPPTADTLELSVPVPLTGGSSNFDLTVDMKDATGAVLFHSGPTQVTATTPGVPPQVTPLVIRYVGTGANALGVRFTAPPTSVFFGDSAVFFAEAYDSNLVAIPNTPILYSSSDTLKAQFPNASAPKVLARSTRGKVTITAQLLTPPTASVPLTVQPRPSAIAVLSGNSQSGPAGAPLAQPIVAKVTASDNLGVQGVTVNFAVVTGGGSLSAASAVTDTLGQAQVTWTLGSGAIGQSVSATVAGVPAATTSFSATATSGPPKALFFTTQPPASPVAGAAFSTVVTARDTFGNTAATFTGNVTIALASNPNGATLSGTLTVAAVAGVATFNNLSLDKVGAVTIAATSGTLTGATSGAVTVSAGPASAIALVSGNLQIGTVGTQLGVPIVVKVTDPQGNPVAGQSVTFAAVTGGGSTGTTTTTTNASGLAQSTWTTGAATFTQTASVTSGSLTGSPVTFTALGTPPGTTNRWTGATSTVWSTGTNWSTGVAPVSTDSVFVPKAGAFATNQPVLTGAASVGNLYTEPGSVIDLSSSILTTTGNVGVSSVVATGSGSLTLAGTSKNVAGSLPAVLVTGSYTQSGAVTITGTLTINGATGTQLVVAGNALTTTDSLTLGSSQGVLVMTNAADSVEIGTNARFFGTATSTALTAGVLRVRGGITVPSGGYFVPGPLHRTVLNGATSQSLSLVSGNNFGTLEIRNAAGAAWAADAAVTGNLIIHTGSGPVTGVGRTITLSGSLVDSVGTAWQVGTTQLAGTPNPRRKLPRNLTSNLIVTGVDTLSDTLHVTGTLTINGASAPTLVVAGFTLTTTDSLTTGSSQGSLVMNNPADSVEIGGNARFFGTASSTVLTAGVLRVRGGITVPSGGYFQAGPAHRTVLNGATAQSLSLVAGNSFGTLEVRNPAGAVWASPGTVSGRMIIHTGAGPVTGSAQTVALSSDLLDSIGTAWQVTTTQLSGTPNPRRKLPRNLLSNLLVTGRDTLGDTLHVTGKVTINGSGAALVVAGFTLTTTDSLALPSQGFLYMRNPADSVDVGGVAYFNGSSSGADTVLTAGVLRVRGNFNVQTAGNFSAAGTHRTVLNGGTAQTITFFSSGTGAGGGHFQVLEAANPAGLVWGSNGVVNGRMIVHLGAGAITGATSTVTLGSDLLDSVGTAWQPKSTQLVNTPNPRRKLPRNLASNLFIAGADTLADTLHVTGMVGINGAGAALVVAGFTLTTTDSLSLPNQGYLVMRNAADSVEVGGVARFNGSGSSLDTLLTAGVLRVRGNFAVQTAGNFSAAGTHRVVLNGAAIQTVTFSSSGQGASAGHFFNLDVLNSAGGVSFGSAATINGTVRMLGATNVTSTTGAQTIVAGLVDASQRWQPSQTIFSGVNPTLPAAITSTVTFTNSATLTAGLTITGSLNVGSGGNLNLGGKTVTVTGAGVGFNTAGSGVLTMQNVGNLDTLNVLGTVVFGGGNETGLLANGAIKVSSAFQSSCSTCFVGSNSHTVIFAVPPTGSLAVTMTGGGPTGTRFQNALILGSSTGTLAPGAGGMYVAGNLVDSIGNLVGTGTTAVAGNVRQAAGTSVSAPSFQLGGTLTLPTTATFNPASLTFSGTNQIIPPAQAGLTYNAVTVAGLDTVGLGATPTMASLTVTGTLVIGGRALKVSGALATSGTGSLVMTNAADSLDIGGNATFAGGPGTTNAGVIRIAGNFAQTGTNSFQGLAQSATVAHRVVLQGSTTTTINFADATNSFFRRLWIAKGAGSGITLQTNVRTTYFAQTTGTTGFSGSGTPFPKLIVDTIAGAGGGSNITSGTGLVIQLGGVSAPTGVISDSGTINVDTLIFAGANDSIKTSTGPGTITYKSIRVAEGVGTARFFQTTTLTNDLVVSSGTLSLNGFHIGVSGNFRTESTGALQMINAADSLGVTGNVTFGGGSTTGLLTSGIIDVKGNFTQSGGSTYAPSGSAHRTRFDLPGSAVIQTISFASQTSFFDSLVLDRGFGTRGTIQFLTDATVSRGVLLQNSTDVTGPTAHVKIAGGALHAILGTTSPTLAMSSLELINPPAIGIAPVNISPDTMVLNGVITSIPTGGVTYKSIRVSGPSVALNAGSVTTLNDFIVEGSGATFSMGVSTSSLNVGGNLVTSTGGQFQMGASCICNVTVSGNATFNGNNPSGSLAAGTLRVAGNFTQGNNANSFVATGSHTTELFGTGVPTSTATQTVTFANGDSLSSRFNTLLISNSDSGGVTIASDVFAVNQLSTPFGPPYRRIYSPAGKRIVARGANVDSLILDNTQIVFAGPNTLTFNNSIFRNFNAAFTQLSLVRPAGTATFSTIQFPITNPNPGFYVATQLIGVTGGFTLTLSGTTPIATANGGRISQGAGTTITWQ